MKLGFYLAAALLTLAPSLVAQEFAPKSPRPITIDDFFQIRDVSQPELSPDGQWVAYAVRTRLLKDDKSEQRLWMVSTRGGDPIPLTAEAATSTHPRWSPDGKYLSFLSARNDAKNQVWLLDRRGGEAQRLTEIPQGVNDFEWSPDSTRLVLILQDPKPGDAEAAEAAKEKDKDKPAPKPKTPPPFVIDRLQFKQDTVGYLDRRRTHLYVIDVASKKLTQISSGDFDDEDPAWSPDGKSLAFSSNRSKPDPDRNFNTDIWTVSADNVARSAGASPDDRGAHLTQVTTNPGTDRAPAWSPDGKWIAFTSQTDAKAIDYATHHLAISPSTGGEEKVLTLKLDRNVRRPRFSADGRSLFMLVEDDGTQNVCSIPAAGGELACPFTGRQNVATYSLAKDGAIAARRLSREEGLFVGWSSGSALHGALEYAQHADLKKEDVIVILLPDHGTRYLNKIYNDQWMKDHGFLERSFATAKDIIMSRSGQDSLFTVSKRSKVAEAILVMNREGVDQVPVVDNSEFVGSVGSSSLLEKIIFDPQLKDKMVGEIMDKPMIFVALDSTLDVLSSMLNRDNKALLVRDEKEKVHIITQHEVLKAITS